MKLPILASLCAAVFLGFACSILSRNNNGEATLSSNAVDLLAELRQDSVRSVTESPAPDSIEDYDDQTEVIERGVWSYIPGGMSQVSVGSSTAVWGVRDGQRIYQRRSAGWDGKPGQLKQVSLASDGAAWGVSDSGRVFRWVDGGWQYYPERRLAQISVGSEDDVWGVDTANQVYRRAPSEWQPIAGLLVHVSSGSDGTVWGIEPSGVVVRRIDSSWEKIPGPELAQVSVGTALHVWGVDADWQVYRWNGRAWDKQDKQLKQVSVGEDGAVWGVDGNNRVFRHAGIATPPAPEIAKTPLASHETETGLESTEVAARSVPTSSVDPAVFGYGLDRRTGTVPLLTILLEFENERFDRDRNAAYYRRLLFGAGDEAVSPNIAGRGGLFSQLSNGHFWFENAGVVGPVLHPTLKERDKEGGEAAMSAALAESLRLAQQRGFDFKRYDANGDGTIEAEELKVLVIFAKYAQGANRKPAPYPLFLPGRDGTPIVGGFLGTLRSVFFAQNVPLVGEKVNAHTIAHELVHHTGIGWEAYGADCNNFPQSLMSCPTSFDGKENLAHTDPMVKMQLGWTKPTVVTTSARGTVELRATSMDLPDTNKLYLVYDPRRGTDEFFLLEHRFRASRQSRRIPIDRVGLYTWA